MEYFKYDLVICVDLIVYFLIFVILKSFYVNMFNFSLEFWNERQGLKVHIFFVFSHSNWHVNQV